MTTFDTGAIGMALTIRTLRDDPGLADALLTLDLVSWPAFMLASPVSTRCWPLLLELAPELQFVLVDEDSGAVVAGGHAVPCVWDGTIGGLPAGWDDVLSRGVDEAGSEEATAISALSIVVAPEHRSRGLSPIALAALRRVSRASGFMDLIAPVRPSRKHAHPLLPIEAYIAQKRPDGRPCDPWLRAHTDAGATPLAVAERSMVIEGTIDEWRAWTGIDIAGSGSYVVPHALVPVTMDCEGDAGTYVESNVWVHHRLGPGEA